MIDGRSVTVPVLLSSSEPHRQRPQAARKDHEREDRTVITFRAVAMDWPAREGSDREREPIYSIEAKFKTPDGSLATALTQSFHEFVEALREHRLTASVLPGEADTRMFRLPAYLASALINGDVTGLGDEPDALKVVEAAEKLASPGHYVGVGEDTRFAWYCDLPGWGRRGVDVADFTVLYRRESPLFT